jgi:hypothetical protein
MKKNQSIFEKLMSVIIVILMINMTMSCEGPDGPSGENGAQGVAGATGPAGPAGPKGEVGPVSNANVTLFTFAEVDFRSVVTNEISVPTLVGEDQPEILLLTFLIGSEGIMYPVPGRGVNNSSEYGSFLRPETNSIDVVINKLNGPGELYPGIRVFRIFAQSTENGRVQFPDIDWQDYNAIAEYYGFENN